VLPDVAGRCALLHTEGREIKNVVMKRRELLEILQCNRDNHVSEAVEARNGHQKALKAKLEEGLDAIDSGKEWDVRKHLWDLRPPEVLEKAFENTVELLKTNVEVVGD